MRRLPVATAVPAWPRANVAPAHAAVAAGAVAAAAAAVAPARAAVPAAVPAAAAAAACGRHVLLAWGHVRGLPAWPRGSFGRALPHLKPVPMGAAIATPATVAAAVAERTAAVAAAAAAAATPLAC